MDYEKKYKEALRQAKETIKYYKGRNRDEAAIEDLQEIFPELKESEGDKTKKELILYLKGIRFTTDECAEQVGKWIAWIEKQDESDETKAKSFLINKGYPIDTNGTFPTYEEMYNIIREGLEKQGEYKPTKGIVETWKDMRLEVYQQASGNRHEPNYSDDNTKMFSLNDIDEIIEKMSEHNPADKVEQKFHEGDWMCENEPNNYARFIQILEIVNVQGKERYRISRDLHNDEDVVEFEYVEKYYHKFDIKDTKDGDMLVNGSNIFIFHYINSTRLMGYCHVNTDDERFYDDIGKNECFCLIDAIVNPATKEQRNLLFQKMKEAGFEWDAENKEVKKIESSTAWSEEDEVKINRIVACLENLNVADNDILLKDVAWLKSLKPQNCWKPSEEQVKALEHFVRSVGESGYASPYENNTKLLYSLLEQLKKLREE